MKQYIDIFKKPITADDVKLAVYVVTSSHSTSPALLQRKMRIGYGKAATLLKLLEDAHVVGKPNAERARLLILSNRETATNAALRQLKKGNR